MGTIKVPVTIPMKPKDKLSISIHPHPQTTYLNQQASTDQKRTSASRSEEREESQDSGGKSDTRRRFDATNDTATQKPPSVDITLEGQSSSAQSSTDSSEQTSTINSTDR